jgi:hypothetical protein
VSLERGNGPLRYAGPPSSSGGATTNLADLLERILDKGIVIAGDISISLVDIELLTIKLRLLVASVDKAQEMGVNWWEGDPWLNARAAEQQGQVGDGDRPRGRGAVRNGHRGEDHALGSGRDDQELKDRLDRIEKAVERLVAAREDEDGR